jgi:predicted HTH domain antitoxin
MPLTITDEELHTLGMSEREARIELACRLFDAGRLHLWPAAKFAGLTRVEMEAELAHRNIPIYRPSVEDLKQDLANLEAMEARERRHQ